MDAAKSTVTAIAIFEDRIVGVGSSREISPLVGPSTVLADLKGAIGPGKYADLVALGTDPREVTSSAIPEIQVLFAMAGGKIMYRSKPSVELAEFR